jgi:hypothetical protein
MPIKSEEARRKKNANNKIYQQRRRDKEKAERLGVAVELVTAERIRKKGCEDDKFIPAKPQSTQRKVYVPKVTVPSIKPLTWKPEEVARMDKIVIRAYVRALDMNKNAEAEIIKRNPANAHINWELAILENGKEVYNPV